VSSEEGQELEVDHHGKHKPSSPPRRKAKSKPRNSTSRLPLPSRVASPPPLPNPNATTSLHVALEESLGKPKKKPSRRQSGLLNVNMGSGESTASSSSTSKRSDTSAPRAPSPAFGSPIRVQVEDHDDEEMAAVEAEVEVDLDIIMVGIKGKEEIERELENFARRERKKAKGKEREQEMDKEIVVPETSRMRERKRQREEDELTNMTASAAEGNKYRLKDVTNSPRSVSRATLPPLDTNTGSCFVHGRQQGHPATISTVISAILSLIKSEHALRYRSPATLPRVISTTLGGIHLGANVRGYGSLTVVPHHAVHDSVHNPRALFVFETKVHELTFRASRFWTSLDGKT
jgi:hypothetical protein